MDFFLQFIPLKRKKRKVPFLDTAIFQNVETDLQGITQQKMINCFNNYQHTCLSKSKIV